MATLDATEFRLAVNEAEVQLKLAAQDLNRKRSVYRDRAIAKSQVDDAQTQYELEAVRLAKARERLADTRISTPFEAYVARRYFDRFVNVAAGQPIARLLDLTRLQIIINVPESLLATVTQDRLIEAWAEFAFAPGERFRLTYRENRGEAATLAQTYEISLYMNNPTHLNILPRHDRAGVHRPAGLRAKPTPSSPYLP